ALRQLLADGRAAIEAADGDAPAELARARQLAAVARTVDATDAAVVRFLERLDLAERVHALADAGDRALAEGHLGEAGGGALAAFRQALELQPENARALQGLAAVESALIRRAELAAEAGDFDIAEAWLSHAGTVRPETGLETVDDARERVERMRATRIARLRDLGIAALPRFGGIDVARRHLAQLLRLARPGHPAAGELRERLPLAVHHGMSAPGPASRPAAAHRPAGRPGRGRTARTHHPGRALRHVRAGPGVHRRHVRRRARPADGGGPARRVHHGRGGRRARFQRPREAGPRGPLR